MLGYVLLMVFGVWACATAVIMVKACDVAAAPLAAYRLLIAAAALAPLMLRDLRRHRARYGGRHLARTLLPGVLLAAHFVSWIIGARMTLAANASLLVNLHPVAMPFFLYVLLRERLTGGELVGTGVAVAGVVLLAGTDYHFSPQHFAGDALCLLSMLLIAAYLAFGRRNRDFPTIWLYVVPVYLVAGLTCLAVAGFQAVRAPGPSAAAFAIPTARDALLVVGLGLVPTVMGHSIMNFSMKHLRGQLVSLTNCGQFVFAGTMAYFLLDEAPQWNFYAAAVLVLAGVYAALRAMPRPTPPRPDVE
ncbi:MAG: DMT family transporter [Planctomycetota bacterium]